RPAAGIAGNSPLLPGGHSRRKEIIVKQTHGGALPSTEPKIPFSPNPLPTSYPKMFPFTKIVGMFCQCLTYNSNNLALYHHLYYRRRRIPYADQPQYRLGSSQRHCPNRRSERSPLPQYPCPECSY